MRAVRTAIQSALILTMLVLGCTKPGSEFVGKWVNTRDTTDTVQMDRNGSEFLITGPDGTKIGASLKDETLTMAQPMSGVTFTYVKSSDSLLSQGMMGQVEYKRAK
jgi:hypothetical protein